MKKFVQIREYGWLTTEHVDDTLDCAQVSTSAFDHICELANSFSKGGARIAFLEGERRLRMDSYVGVLQTPCGTTVEILPKVQDLEDNAVHTRSILRKMIQAVLELPYREAGLAAIEVFDAPLTEWVMRQFLLRLDHLLKSGLRFDYARVEEEMGYLKGQLDLSRQLRQGPEKMHRFHVRHDIYLPSGPENRLLKRALECVRKATVDAENWRLAQELSMQLHEVTPSSNVDADLQSWRSERLMVHYRDLKPWCELILKSQTPLALHAESPGMSLLFPMEKLFERYVARELAARLPNGSKLRTQVASEYLCWHADKPSFRLQPDLLIEHKGRKWVLDTKWKRIDQSDLDANYGLLQSDFYQMFAYGHRYLNGQGRTALIFPRSSTFTTPLKSFTFQDGLELYVLPFNLDSGAIDGLELLGMAAIPLGAVNTPA